MWSNFHRLQHEDCRRRDRDAHNNQSKQWANKTQQTSEEANNAATPEHARRIAQDIQAAPIMAQNVRTPRKLEAKTLLDRAGEHNTRWTICRFKSALT